MKTVYLVRHGETEGNTGKIYQGEDTPLTEHGREQARLVGERCSKLTVDALVTSHTLRAQQTAKIIGEKLDMAFETSPLFAERRRPASLMGRSTSDVYARRMEDAWRKGSLGDGPRVEDGEHFDDIKSRILKALAFLQNHPADNILVVTHGFFLRALVAGVVFADALTSSEFKRVMFSFATNNTGISVFQLAEQEDSGTTRWFIRILNDHTHLG